MNPFVAALLKAGDVCLLYPFHRIIHHQHVHNKSFVRTFKTITRHQNLKNLYKGLGLHVAQSSINRYTDVMIYNHFNTSNEAILLSSCFKFYWIHLI